MPPATTSPALATAALDSKASAVTKVVHGGTVPGVWGEAGVTGTVPRLILSRASVAQQEHPQPCSGKVTGQVFISHPVTLVPRHNLQLQPLLGS